jgi:nucleoid-associated protein YgaU
MVQSEITDKAVADAATMAATRYNYGVEMPSAPIETVNTAPIDVVDAAPTAEAAPDAPTTASSGIETPTTHTVVSGDTLGSIALNYYGKSSKWREIRTANPNILGGSIKLSLGMELQIPAMIN